jgi:Protein of unknown function (DUF2877)
MSALRQLRQCRDAQSVTTTNSQALKGRNRFIMLLSIGDQVKPGTYRFHSRFDRAVNFVHKGRLIAVVDEVVGPGPLNIVLRSLKLAQAQGRTAPAPSILKGLPHSAQGWIASPCPGDPTLGKRLRKPLNPERVESPTPFNSLLQVSPTTVLFAGHRYHFTARHRYVSALDCQIEDLPRFQRNLSVLGDSLKEDAPPKSLAFLLDGKRRRNFRAGFERAFVQQITRGVHQVFHGPLLSGIQQLKGCGFGLTPAGDDFIAGFLIGLHLMQKLRGQDAQSTINAVFRAARDKNIFSNTFLDLARQGLLLGYLKDLLVALVSGSEASVRRSSRKLFTVGETSGADLATGLFMTLQSSL